MLGGRGVGDPKSGVLTLLSMGWGLWVPHKWGLSPHMGGERGWGPQKWGADPIIYGVGGFGCPIGGG